VRQRVSAFLLPVVVLSLCLLFAAGCDRGQHPTQIGNPAPDFSVSEGGRAMRLSSYRGKVVVLNFWASWCAPCIEEIPSLDALQHQLPQIAVLGVSTDEDAAAYHQFLTDHPIGFVTIRDGSQHSNASFGTFRFPETYVIDPHGMIRRKFIGPQEWTTPEILGYLSNLK
jgi:cytochrome c biogenesis protein CcmG/thiol:disulfide interchange protein DsbE